MRTAQLTERRNYHLEPTFPELAQRHRGQKKGSTIDLLRSTQVSLIFVAHIT